jgi:hypothetical protein
MEKEQKIKQLTENPKRSGRKDRPSSTGTTSSMEVVCVETWHVISP